MKVKIATWNINSVRLRMPLVERFTAEFAPDILCLQETKVRNSEFPENALRKLGYDHIAINGQAGYHGVATASRLPFTETGAREFCGKGDARHVSVTLDQGAAPVTLHNFYVPAGGDEPDRKVNDKFGHKLDFLTEMTSWFSEAGNGHAERMVLVGDLNIAPLETDVWSHKQLLKVVSHTPIEIEHLSDVQASADWQDAVRTHIPPEEKLYTWWSYRAKDWRAADKGRRLDHIWLTPALDGACSKIDVVKDVRGWEKPSDHAPILATLEI